MSGNRIERFIKINSLQRGSMTKMNNLLSTIKKYVAPAVVGGALVATAAGCRSNATYAHVTIEDLLQKPSSYYYKDVTVEGIPISLDGEILVIRSVEGGYTLAVTSYEFNRSGSKSASAVKKDIGDLDEEKIRVSGQFYKGTLNGHYVEVEKSVYEIRN